MRLLVSFFVCALLLQPAYSKQKQATKLDPAVKVCLLTEGSEFPPPVYKLYSFVVGADNVFLVLGNTQDRSEPGKNVFCLFKLNSENKYEIVLPDHEANTKVENIKRDIEYLKLKKGDPGYESYQKRLETAGKELADRRIWIRDAYEYLSKLDYYPIPKDKTDVGKRK